MRSDPVTPSIKTFWRHGYPAAVLFLAAILAAWMLLAPRRGASLVVTITASKSGTAQLYLDRGQGFSEALSVAQAVTSGSNDLRFDVPPGELRALRLDPLNRGDAEVVVSGLRLEPSSQGSGGPVELSGLAASHDIGSIERTATKLRMRTTGADPQLVTKLPTPLHIEPGHKRVGHTIATALLLAMLGVWALVTLAGLGTANIVSAGLGGALVLIIAMDALTQGMLGAHPDEFLHLSCFSFFIDNFWPAAAGDPRMAASLMSSPFGTSYLNRYDVVYFIAAHATAALGFLAASPLALARAFQHALWLILLIVALRSRARAIALGAALVSAQTWYLFSYFNGDAFPLFLCLLSGALLSDHEGSVQRFLRGEQPRLWGGVLLFAFCLGLLVVSKANYLPVVLGIFLWLAVQHLQLKWRELAGVVLGVGFLGVAVFMRKLNGVTLDVHPIILVIPGLALALLAILSLAHRYWRDADLRPGVHRVALLAGVALLVAMPRIVDDLYLNGLPAAKAAAVTAAKEAYAAPAFKPSLLAAGKGLASLDIARKGVTLHQMLFGPMQWFALSARSAFGAFGYMSVWASIGFYPLAWIASGALAAYLMIGMVIERRGLGLKLVFLAVSISALVLLSSMLFSWVVGFQPQGRYLLPIMGMLCLVMGNAQRWLERWPGKLALVICAVLSIYSFACIGLPGINQPS